MKLGVGQTKVGTKLDFNVMGNPFGIKKLNEEQAVSLINKAGFKFKQIKKGNKVVAIKPLGNENEIYDFIERLTESKVFVSNNEVPVF